MREKAILLKQFNACFYEHSTFASLDQALDGITVEQASRKLGEKTNSIWEIVNHLIFYNKRYYDLFHGYPLQNIRDNTNTFGKVNRLDWQETIQLCFQILADWLETIEHTDNKTLNGQVKEGSEDTRAMILAKMIIHNAYHIGQIIYLRKLQRAWEVNLN